MLKYPEADGRPAAKDVDFGFSACETLKQNVNRLLVGQIQHAVASVSNPADPEKAVHACRLVTKRMEALLLLLGDPPAVKALRKQTKSLQKMLSKYRDTTVLRGHVAELPVSKSRYRMLATLDAKLTGFYGDFSNATEPVVLKKLAELRDLVDDVAVTDDFSTLAPGLKKTYAKSRIGVLDLSKSAPIAAKQLHQWRAHVKRHGYHLELLLPCAPVVLEPRLLAVNHLGQCLGEYHDLELTRREVDKPKLKRRIRAQQQDLLVDILALQRWAMQPRPAVWLESLKHRWDAWYRSGR